MNTVRKSAVAAALTAGLIGGGAAGAILGTAGISGAQEDTTTTVAPGAEDGSGSTEGSERPDASARLGEVLAPLVEDGTITQAQADAVVATLVEAAPERGGKGRGGHRGHLGEGLETTAGALGMTTDELRTALSDGQTLSQIAEAQGVDLQVVIDAMLAETESRLAEKVAAGDITQEEADEKLEGAAERITERVENGPPERGPRGGERPDAGTDEAPEDAPAGD